MLDIREEEPKGGKPKRPYVSIYWKCCRVYSHVYRKPSVKFYCGHCPKCRANVHIPVGNNGINQRIFVAE